MTETVDLVSYLPQFMTEFKEIPVTLEAENPEFRIVWEAADRVLQNEFIATADEYGISRFEKMLNLYPSKEDTLEMRRLRVQTKWFDQLPYTMKVLVEKLTILCDGTDFTLTHNFKDGYTLTLQTDLELFGQVDELEKILVTMLPCTIIMNIRNEIYCFAGGTALFGGGIVDVREILITNDWKFEAKTEGALKMSGASSDTVQVTLTNDFREFFTVKGSNDIGSGVIFTETITN